MASIYSIDSRFGENPVGPLADPALAIGGPRIDALFFWGAPAIALAFVLAWIAAATALPVEAGRVMGSALASFVGIVTYAHLIAVFPRAYLNREVFAAHRLRLTLVPVLLVAGMALSPALLACGVVLAVFWDVHHSALQTFGIARIYDMKAGNDAYRLRRVDLLLNWALYVGPIGFGASLFVHLHAFDRLGPFGWTLLTTLPGLAEGAFGWIRLGAISAWALVVGLAILEYRRARTDGYAMPGHKAALLGTTALVSILAWGFLPPIAAFLVVNLFHAAQYFALVWLKEGARMRMSLASRPRLARSTALLFVLFCTLFGIVYDMAYAAQALLAPFIACSLLHFWYDSFIWSVRKKQI